ncbi:BREX-2 system adenine-specific DNA-methyltransferase PglX [Corallococcus exiguus]|nr:BREX-2 system adenine-specific DNA-methyltransferase PglX [Corallococcus exiguus]
MSIANLPKLLQPALKALEKDLLARAKTERVEAGLKRAWEDEQKAGQTGLGFEPWRRERITQLAVAWILSVVFVRTLEDRGYVDPRVAGATADALRAAEDREALFLHVAPFLGPREYLLAVFRELAKLPGARDVFDTKHNPVWVLSPSSEGAQALLDFFRKRDASGAPALIFAGEDTRFLGDLYQDLSEAVRKRYALLQTPEFVEEFILDQTLDPAIAEFGLKDASLIDPTCGSGHFLLGAFRRLLGRWQKEAPTENIADLARRALDQVYGVDINPYAVAIARFRLVLALLDAVGIKRLERAPDIKPNVVVADSLLHRFDQRADSRGQMSLGDDLHWGEQIFRLENRGEVERLLTRRFHAVVGNPPYITEKDGSKRKKYREMYESAAGAFALAAPFTERFFELALDGGFVGLINSNAWTKQKYGTTLIQKVLRRLDVSKIVDTAGCYLPGHGTPTLLLFGRNRKPGDSNVIAVLGKRGEQAVPADPSRAPVWSAILTQHNSVGSESAHISVEALSRKTVGVHPWVLVGGGALALKGVIDRTGAIELSKAASDMGFGAVTRDDESFVVGDAATRWGIAPTYVQPFITGKDLRDWAIAEAKACIWPYDGTTLVAVADPAIQRALWPWRARLVVRVAYGKTQLDRGLLWSEYSMYFAHRFKTPLTLAFAFVATHNNFVLDRSHKVFNRHAPIIKLHSKYDESDHQALLGYLNSSTVAFWCRLVMFPKGGDVVGDGARLSAAQWNRHLEFAGNLLKKLPIPKFESLREQLFELVVAAEAIVEKIGELSHEKIVANALATNPTLTAIRDVRSKSLAERSRLRGVLISLQEEMDWRIYGLLGLPTVTAPSVDTVRVHVEPNHRPFEVRLARDVETDISASEWFRMNKREAPKDVGGPLADIYRQRLRLLDDPEQGKQLRLLETPETKRRWPPADDIEAFANSLRKSLLNRIEASFREQSTPELRTARQLALELGRDPAVAAVHELLTEESGIDLVKLISDLVDSEGVPFLAGYRYSETGMEKRASWEETWRLQRLEDEGKLAPELKRLNLKAIPVPDKYGPKDFLRHYWSLRGKLDVAKERFVTVPSGNTDEDTTPLVGWAGWDQLQVAQALSGLYQRRKTDDGWTKDRLVPLLAGINERVPWLLQWHNEIDPAYGTKLGEFFRDFVAGEAHSLGVAVSDLRTWTPPAAPKRTTVDPNEVLVALSAWKPEVEDDENDDGEDDDGEETEPPEGPTDVELASAVGATKALVAKALKKLVADGLVEKLSGRPARYVATGDQA